MSDPPTESDLAALLAMMTPEERLEFDTVALVIGEKEIDVADADQWARLTWLFLSRVAVLPPQAASVALHVAACMMGHAARVRQQHEPTLH